MSGCPRCGGRGWYAGVAGPTACACRAGSRWARPRRGHPWWFTLVGLLVVGAVGTGAFVAAALLTVVGVWLVSR